MSDRLPNPTVAHNQPKILGFLGIPNAEWEIVWENLKLQNIYADLRLNCQTFRQEYFTTTMFVKPSYVIQKLEEEADGEDPFKMQSRRHWEDDLQQAYAVKRICEELGGVFLVFKREDGEPITKEMIVMGIMLICRIFRSCRGRVM